MYNENIICFSVNIVIIKLLILVHWNLIPVNILVKCFSINSVILQLIILVTWKSILANILARVSKYFSYRHNSPLYMDIHKLFCIWTEEHSDYYGYMIYTI